MSDTDLTFFELPLAAVDVGYFSTKFTTGRDGGDTQRPAIQASSIPSYCPRVDGEASAGAGMSSLSGVVVEVDGAKYFVGPDAALRSSGLDARVTLENYADSEAYLALFRGALHYICRSVLHSKRDITKVSIKRIVVGLPLNTLASKSNALRGRVEGLHHVPAMPWAKSELQVEVRSCTVLPQPQGALFFHGGSNKEIFKQNTLVLDLGGGTFDWFLTHGQKVLYERSGAYPKGMLACAFTVCDQIRKSLRDDMEIVKRVDLALRENAKHVRIGGKNMDLAPFEPAVKATLNDSLQRMLDSVKSLDSIDLILFTGGGAPRLHALMLEMFPERGDTMKLDADPVYSNVRGFHVVGEVMNHAG